MSLAIRTRKQSFVRLQKKKNLLQSHGICLCVPLALVYVPNLSLDKQFWLFGPNLPLQGEYPFRK